MQTVTPSSSITRSFHYDASSRENPTLKPLQVAVKDDELPPRKKPDENDQRKLLP
jgi:hypothetical protein